MSPQEASTLSFSNRAELANTPPLARYLFSLIAIKRSNLAVSADVHTTQELLRLAEDVGDHICILKTHADIIDDWSSDTIKALQTISRRKHFLLFEDRKFGDIGNTLQLQYTRGPLQIATWAHLTNAHLLPGPKIVEALHAAADETLTSMNQSVATTISTGTPRRSLDDPQVPVKRHAGSTAADTSAASSEPDGVSSSGPAEDHLVFSHTRSLSGAASATTTISQSYEPISPPQHPSFVKRLSQDEQYQRDPAQALTELGPPPHARGLLLLAEMSSEGHLMTPEYTKACVQAAIEDKGFVLGFIAQRSLNVRAVDNFVTLAPGVSIPPEGQTEAVTGDGKGQKWRGPREVIVGDGIDVVIVGRGILRADDRRKEAQRYQQKAWEAYEERIGRRKRS